VEVTMIGLLCIAQVQAGAPESPLWVDVLVETRAGERAQLAMPYDWLDDGVLSAELSGAVEVLELDLSEAAAELAAAVPGTRREWWWVHDDEVLWVGLEARPGTGGRSARRLVVELSPDDRMTMPLFAARAALKWVDTSALDPVEDWLEVDSALQRMARLEPFTLLELDGPEGRIRVGTE
jgi:hypothetical protein